MKTIVRNFRENINLLLSRNTSLFAEYGFLKSTDQTYILEVPKFLHLETENCSKRLEPNKPLDIILGTFNKEQPCNWIHQNNSLY